MPNFEVRITSGASRAVWTDEPTETKPTRLNANEARPHTYREVTLGDSVTASAIVDGVTGPLDADLGGELFTSWFGEVPAWPAPGLTSPAGQSSVISFTTEHEGHHLLVFSRSSGGRFLVPFWVVGA